MTMSIKMMIKDNTSNSYDNCYCNLGDNGDCVYGIILRRRADDGDDDDYAYTTRRNEFDAIATT